MKNFGIKVKLLILVVPLAVTLICASFFYSKQMHSIKNQSEEIFYDKLYQISSLLINADRDYYQSMLAAMEYYDLENGFGDIEGDRANELKSKMLADYSDNLQQTKDRVGQAIAIASDEGLLYTELRLEGDSKSFKAYADEFMAGIEDWEASYSLTAGTGSWNSFCEKFESTRESLSNMTDITEEWAVREDEMLEKNMIRSINILFFAFIAIAIVLAVFSLFVSRIIANSMQDMTERIEVLSKNDLSQKTVWVEQNDEIGKMMRAFAEMQSNLSRVIGRLKDTADGLVESCHIMDQNTEEASMSMRDINNAAGELADTATQTASNVEDVSRGMDDISGIMSRSVATADTLNDASTRINAVTDEGVRIVDTLTKINSQSLEAFESIFRAIANIQDSADKISGASDLISSVAEQTNLLSLNASIEAARAGDAGRGFAVVAEEIRQLSDESASSVDTINTLLAELQQNTTGAIEKSNLVKSLVDKQSESVRDTRGSFDHIVDAVRKVEEAIAEIRSINNELDTGIRNITELVESLSAASEENAATAEELSATSDVVNRNVEELRATQEAINSASGELEEVVNLFKLS